MTATTLSALLHDSAGKWPERVALGEATVELAVSYRELDTLVSDLADQLTRVGVGAGDSVAIVSDNSIEYPIALFAVLALGASAAPLNPALPPTQLHARFGRLSARAAIVPSHLHADIAAALGHAGIPIWKLALKSGQPELSGSRLATSTSVRSPAPDGVALRMLTSGTTAAPKIVPLTHTNVLASVEGVRRVYRLEPDDGTLLVMPLFHGHGLIAGLLATLASGGTAFLPSEGRFHAGRFWAEMEAARATWYTAVPTIHQILLARGGSGLPKLRFVRSCSSPLAPTVLRELENAFAAPVLEAYGMTETAHQVASNPLPSDGPHKPGSVGVVTGAEIEVRHGELWVRGASVTAGYLDNPKANAESFTDGWFHTGDLGRIDDDGYLFLTGRSKEIINRGGEKISPAAIDEVLQSNPSVEDALSFAVPDEKYGEEIEAAAVLRPGAAISEDELKRYASSALSSFEVPKRIFFVPQLPRTEKGAGDRRRLAAQLHPTSTR